MMQLQGRSTGVECNQHKDDSDQACNATRHIVLTVDVSVEDDGVGVGEGLEIALLTLADVGLEPPAVPDG